MSGTARILVADSVRHTRSLVCTILRGAGLRELYQAASSDELLKVVDVARPRIVIIPNAFPGMSGIAFTRLLRAGLNYVPRETSVILTVGAPTRALLEEARVVGVDEVLAFPFTTAALLARVKSVIDRPRPFIDCEAYTGPCRRRLMLGDYKGPLRRAGDPDAQLETDDPTLRSNRAAARRCVQKMSEYRDLLPEADCERLREVYRSVMSPETRQRQEADDRLGDAARRIYTALAALPPGDKPGVTTLRDQVDLLFACVNDLRPAVDAPRHPPSASTHQPPIIEI